MNDYNRGVDEHTLEKLEFDRIRELLSRHAQCALGRSMALRLQPGRRSSQVTRWLGQAKEFERWMATHGSPPFANIRDVREQVRRAVPPAKLEPEEFADLAGTLMGMDAVRRYLPQDAEDDSPLAAFHKRLGNFGVIVERINRAIDARGKVRDDASERLKRIRGEIQDVRRRIRAVFDKLLQQPSITRYLQYTNTTFHADRLVLPLKAEQRGRLPGIVHRSSDSGQTLFVEPAEAVELNNSLVNLRHSEDEEISRILWDLTHLVHLNQQEILRSLETLAVIDLLTAKVRFGHRYDMSFAEINTKHHLRLKKARNPILMAIFDKETGTTRPNLEVIPIDVRLGDDFDIMMITGPNTGGKTATLKTVGLMAVMTQAGLPIPVAAGSTLPVFHDIWIDVGDEQSLEQSLSTFSAHLGRILDIMKHTARSTLVLLDELGAGTDPEEGAAIGRALTNHLLSRGCLAMLTTHLGSLKAIGYEKNRVDNAAVQFDLDTLKPTYKLAIGEPGNSNAIAIASRLGMPKKLVKAARANLTHGHKALDRAISGTLRVRREAERARRDAEKARADSARATLKALDRHAELEKRQNAYAAWVRRVITLKPGDIVRVRGFDKPGHVLRLNLEKQQASIEVGSLQLDIALSELIFEEK